MIHLRFKYRNDADTFEKLRKKYRNDEAKAWIEYTKIKDSEKKAREVIDPKRHDEEMGIDVLLLRRQNNPENMIGPGWTVKKEDNKKQRTRWVSPTRKMGFR